MFVERMPQKFADAVIVAAFESVSTLSLGMPELDSIGEALEFGQICRNYG